MNPVGVEKVIRVVIGNWKLDRQRIDGLPVLRVPLRVTEHEDIGAAGVPVNLRIALIVAGETARRAYKVVVNAKRVAGGIVGSRVGFGIVRKKNGDRIIYGNLIVRISLRLSRGWVNRLRVVELNSKHRIQRRQITFEKCLRSQAGGRYSGTVIPHPLIVDEEEKLVLDNWAAEGCAKLRGCVGVFRQRRHVIVIAPAIGVEVIVLEGTEDAAVERIGAALHD